MNLLDYIKGNRKGKKAHDIERQSMQDPFLYEAIEGFDGVDDNHIARIEDIQKRIKVGTHTKRRGFQPLIKFAAACVVILITIGGYFVLDANNGTLQAQQKSVEIMEIYMPKELFTENIVLLSKQNAEQLKPYTDVVRGSRMDDKNIAIVNPEMVLLAEADNKTLIAIYQPAVVTEIATKIVTKIVTEKKKVPATISHTTLAMADIEELSEFSQSEVLAFKPVASAPKMMRKKAIASAADALILESMPEIGWESFNKYIGINKQEATDTCSEVQGTVILEFAINDEGLPIDIKIIQSVCSALDQEAIRLLKYGGKWLKYRMPARVSITF